MVIDAHAHIFRRVNGMTRQGATQGLGYGRISVGGAVSSLIPPYNPETCFTPEMLLTNLDWAGVDVAVLLQGPFYGEDNPYVLRAIFNYPDRLIGLACLDPWAEDARKAFEWIMKAEVFKGIKLECSFATGLMGLHPGARLDWLELAWLWREMERAGMVLVLDLGGIDTPSYQTEAVRSIAEHYPSLKIVLAHLGQPRPEMENTPELLATWNRQIDLGLLPNVWFDCAALPAYYPQEEYPFPSAEKALLMAIDRIGIAKMMWGSDQPGLLVRASLPQLVKLMKYHLRSFSAAEQHLIMGGTAAHVFC